MHGFISISFIASSLLVPRFSFGSEVSGVQSLAEYGFILNLADIIGNITPAREIMGAFANTNFRDMYGELNDQNWHEWPAIFTCNRTGTPIGIHIESGSNFEGSIDFSLFPDTIQEINFQDTKLTGAVNFFHLPRDLRILHLGNSQFIADFSGMKRDGWPKQLQNIAWIDNNLFTGILDCSELPYSLLSLHLIRIKNLDGILFYNLPSHLERLFLNGNTLKGLDLSKTLPASMQGISLMNTKINGEIFLQGIWNCSSLKFWCDMELRSRLRMEARDVEISIII